ncbi:hypothetical protein [Streptomyces sp. Isolate_219]|uniref:hypothetical protein n=1 Tax=Streptomyces sp. Isolate_219 TaxID=2950110 RepID=UPI0021C96CAC|nr:hypothetical protein [Streptomyces sp. Isolate_219]MCR8574861.1 hypothetical protein [Streptomyces sp. Isolate_219]
MTRSEDEDTAECGAVAAVDLLEEHPHAYPAFAPVIAAARAHRDIRIRSYADDLDAFTPA